MSKPESIKIEVHGIEDDGVCSLSGKGGEVLILTIADGTATEAPLSLRSLIQLLRMKLKPKKAATREPKPANGVPLASALPVTPE